MYPKILVQFKENCLQTIILKKEALRVEIKNELFNTRQKIFVCIKGKKDIPILQINEPLKLKEIEEKASILASFLKVTIKGI